METHQRAILAALVEGRVKFVLIGQLAATLHGSAYFTYDCDVCYERGPENVRKLVAVLRRLNAKLRVGRSSGDEDLALQLEEESILAGGNFMFETDLGWFDCLAWPAGVHGYDALSERATDFDLDGMAVKAASVDDLLLMRRKAGRPKDLERIYELEEIKRILESGEAE